MKTQIFRIAALLLISLFYLTACQKDNPANGEDIQTPDFNDDLAPAWSPDGSKIAYSIGGGGGTYIIDLVQGGPPEKYLDNASYPDWSPDGRQLVFARFETPLSTRSIFKANLDGSGITQLAKPRDNEDEHRYPAYSHSGDRIAFSSLKKGIVIMNADGKNEKRIFKKLSAYPSWSPNDQYLVFEGATETPGRGRLFIIKADGNGLRQLTF